MLKTINWCLVFKHVTIKQGNILSSNDAITASCKQLNIKKIIMQQSPYSACSTHSTVRQSCDWCITEHTCCEHCNTFLTLCACDSQATAVSWQCVQCYPGWHHPDSNVFWWLGQCLQDRESSYTSFMLKQVIHRLYRCQPPSIPYLVWNKNLWEAHVLLQGNQEYSKNWSLIF